MTVYSGNGMFAILQECLAVTSSWVHSIDSVGDQKLIGPVLITSLPIILMGVYLIEVNSGAHGTRKGASESVYYPAEGLSLTTCDGVLSYHKRRANHSAQPAQTPRGRLLCGD